MPRVDLHRGSAETIARSPQMKILLEKKARQVADEARRIVQPYSQRVGDDITPTVGFDERGRMVGRVNANHWTSLFVEFGTLHQSAVAPLRKALESVIGNVRGER